MKNVSWQGAFDKTRDAISDAIERAPGANMMKAGVDVVKTGVDAAKTMVEGGLKNAVDTVHRYVAPIEPSDGFPLNNLRISPASHAVVSRAD
jgi:hypothetical protein